MATLIERFLSRVVVMKGNLKVSVNPARVVVRHALAFGRRLGIDVKKAGNLFARSSMTLIGALKAEVIRHLDALPAKVPTITQRQRIIDEVGKRLALIARSAGNDKFASTPDEDDLLDSWYDNAFNRISIATGNLFASDVNTYDGGYISPAGPQLNNVRFEALNLDGQTVEYLVLDESAAGSSIYAKTVIPVTVLVGMKEYTVFVKGTSDSSVALTDIYVKSFIVGGLPKYLLVTYQAEARRDIQYVLPPELEKAVIYWILYEWFDSILEPRYSAQYHEKFMSDVSQYRFSPRVPVLVERKARWF